MESAGGARRKLFKHVMLKKTGFQTFLSFINQQSEKRCFSILNHFHNSVSTPTTQRLLHNHHHHPSPLYFHPPHTLRCPSKSTLARTPNRRLLPSPFPPHPTTQNTQTRTHHMESIRVLLRVRPESLSAHTPTHHPPQHSLHQLLSPYEELQTPPPAPHTTSTPSHGSTAVSVGGQSCVIVNGENSVSVTGAHDASPPNHHDMT